MGDDTKHVLTRSRQHFSLPPLLALGVIARGAMQRSAGGLREKQRERLVDDTESGRAVEAERQRADTLPEVNQRRRDVRLRLAHRAELLERPREAAPVFFRGAQPEGFAAAKRHHDGHSSFRYERVNSGFDLRLVSPGTEVMDAFSIRVQ